MLDWQELKEYEGWDLLEKIGLFLATPMHRDWFTKRDC